MNDISFVVGIIYWGVMCASLAGLGYLVYRSQR